MRSALALLSPFGFPPEAEKGQLPLTALAASGVGGSFGIAAQGENVWITNYFDKTVTKLRASDGFNLGTFKVDDGAAGIVLDGNKHVDRVQW